MMWASEEGLVLLVSSLLLGRQQQRTEMICFRSSQLGLSMLWIVTRRQSLCALCVQLKDWEEEWGQQGLLGALGEPLVVLVSAVTLAQA